MGGVAGTGKGVVVAEKSQVRVAEAGVRGPTGHYLRQAHWNGRLGADPDRCIHVARENGPNHPGAFGHSEGMPPVFGESMKQEYDFSNGKRGPVVTPPPGKTRVTIRLDDDVLDWFRNEVDQAGGGNYQTLINLALRDYVNRSREPLEKTLRRVIREELRRAG